MEWSELRYRNLVAVDFVESSMCMLDFIRDFHFPSMICFKYDNEADRTSLDCCFATRCAAASASLQPSLWEPCKNDPVHSVFNFRRVFSNLCDDWESPVSSVLKDDQR